MSARKSANKHFALEQWKLKIAECFKDPGFKPLHVLHFQYRERQIVIKVKYSIFGSNRRGLIEWHPPSWKLYFDTADETIEDRLRLYYTGDVNRAIGQIMNYVN